MHTPSHLLPLTFGFTAHVRKSCKMLTCVSPRTQTAAQLTTNPAHESFDSRSVDGMLSKLENDAFLVATRRCESLAHIVGHGIDMHSGAHREKSTSSQLNHNQVRDTNRKVRIVRIFKSFVLIDVNNEVTNCVQKAGRKDT